MTRPRIAIALLLVTCFVACAGILGIRNPPERAFEHRAHAAKGIACVQCHTRVARSGPGDALDLPTTERCLSCHAKPHDTRECSTCHGRQERRDGVAQAKEHLSFSHRDHRGTVVGSCTRCHAGVLQSDEPLRPPMASCLGCHEHRDQWAARSCSPCHRNMQAEGTRPASHVVHGPDFVRQHGMQAAAARDLCESCHAESHCSGCHGVGVVPALPSAWHIDNLGTKDMHGGGFFARHSLEARVDPGLCVTCHRDESTCQACHLREKRFALEAPRGNPHPPGWVSPLIGQNAHGAAARLDPVACASCHGGAGEALCVRCHRVGGPGGNPHPPGFSSRQSLAQLPCRMCHSEGR